MYAWNLSIFLRNDLPHLHIIVCIQYVHYSKYVHVLYLIDICKSYRNLTFVKFFLIIILNLYDFIRMYNLHFIQSLCMHLPYLCGMITWEENDRKLPNLVYSLTVPASQVELHVYTCISFNLSLFYIFYPDHILVTTLWVWLLIGTYIAPSHIQAALKMNFEFVSYSKVLLVLSFPFGKSVVHFLPSYVSIWALLWIFAN